jgi:asparagine synthase (glutamine-hydrolysing)
MCGLAGIFNWKDDAPRIDQAELKAMTDSLWHRGPDEGSTHIDNDIGFGHRRLSIIDVATGQQPVFNEDKNISVVFNGEIYNFETVREELISAGHVFRSKSDTEIIVHGYEQWGVDCLSKFRGMFAFVLHDRRHRRIVIARDRLGVKPLFYSVRNGRQILFGSELKAIVASNGFSAKISRQAIDEYFAFGYIPDPKTVYEGVFKLPSAHYLVIDPSVTSLRPVRYWMPAFEPTREMSVSDSLEELQSLIKESVKLRLISEVPLGAFLSGGVDSSLVVATMSELQSSKSVQTCSIGFEEKAYDESIYAEMVAKHYGCDHEVLRLDRSDQSLIGSLADVYDEPFADASALATLRVSELARKRVTVALSGDGGDEGFAGYRRYQMHLFEDRIRRSLPATFRSTVVSGLASIYPKADYLPRWMRAKTTLEGIAATPLESYFRAVSVVPDALRTRILRNSTKSRADALHPMQVFRDANATFPGGSELDRLQYLDLATWLPGDINTKVDRASMRHSLEVREPLLDHKLMEWAFRLPQTLKVGKNEGKVLLKALAERKLPREVIYRPKMGFSIPVAEWFKQSLGNDLEASIRDNKLASEILDSQAVQQMLNEHRSGLRNHDRALWACLNFGLFCQKFAGADVAELPQSNS